MLNEKVNEKVNGLELDYQKCVCNDAINSKLTQNRREEKPSEHCRHVYAMIIPKPHDGIGIPGINGIHDLICCVYIRGMTGS